MIRDARKENYSAANPIFFDTNIWLSIYAPPSKDDDSWKDAYSRVLNSIVAKQVPVLIDACVLSEYINRYCRMEFQTYERAVHSNSTRNFKDFRVQEPDIYQPIAADVTSQIKEIFALPNLRRINSDFEAMNVQAMLGEFAQGESDWNDQQIVDLCQRNQCALLTNDADFKDAAIDILTCHPRLLRRR